MDLLDFFWLSSDRFAIDELWKEQAGAAVTTARLHQVIKDMQQENDELRLRMGVLLRLLMEQGVISGDRFNAAVLEAREKVALAQVEAQRQRATGRSKVVGVHAKVPKATPAAPKPATPKP